MKREQDRRGQLPRSLDRKEVHDRVSEAEKRVSDFLKDRENTQATPPPRPSDRQ